MKKNTVLLVACLMIGTSACSQVNTPGSKSLTVFERLTQNLESYKLDTTAVPGDKITMTIRKLRNLRGGFNIDEALEYKLEEDRQKKEVPEVELEKFAFFFKTGAGKQWLDNAVIWIYRQHFTYKELKQMVKFYKTSAGQKMATDFPLIVMKSLAAAESIKKIYEKKLILSYQQKLP